MPPLPKSVAIALLAIGMAILAGDFLFLYIPFSGWILQAILVGVYLELFGGKKTAFLVLIMEIFFVGSYGGATAVAFFVSIFGVGFVIPLILMLYFTAVGVVLLLGYIANYLFHKARLFDRIDKAYSRKHHYIA